MLRGMNWGCLSFLILFPAGIFIWAAGERRRRAALPPEELKKLEAEEEYGPIDPKLECVFCKHRNCVRVVSPEQPPLIADLLPLALNPDNPQLPEIEQYCKAHCMNCGNEWEMFPPKEKANQ